MPVMTCFVAGTIHSADASPMQNIQANILLVDDDLRNLDVLESVLASPEVCLIRVQTAQDALIALVDGEFAAIVLDIEMPGTNGIELARLIKQRKRTQHIPLIFLTAHYQEDKDILQGYELGAVDYLSKPINPQILKSKISVFVELFRKSQELARLNQALKNAEQALLHANNELETHVQKRTAELVRANRAKDDFLAALSHELRTPLNPVMLLASESANDPELPESVRESFNIIAKNVGLEARLIDDLLDLTHITHGKLLLEKQPVNVHLTLQDALATIQEDVEKKQIAFNLNLKAEQFIVFGDAMRLQQIFWNVLKNAVKFTPPSGQIMIQTGSNSSNTVIKVTDTGIGMIPEEINCVFNAFSQGEHADPTGTHRFGGLGLGLSITQKLVELHSGNIKAESAGRNQGATFTMEFPFIEVTETSYPAPRESITTLKPSKGGLRILLIEDHENTRTALAQLLTRRQYKVVAVGSAAEARQISRQNEFDLVLSDIGLPDGNGYALMSELRDNFGLKGIALTGYGMEHDVEHARKAGFVAHLIKPVHIKSLENALNAFN
jgi:signal transduction histidine kinase